MNIDPKIWGRSAWDFLYFVALSYPKYPNESDKLRYKNFFLTAGTMVPCDKCRKNFRKHSQELPIENYLNTGYDLFSWIVKMDNKVRALYGGKQYNTEETFNHYMKKIEGQKGKGNENENYSYGEKVFVGIGLVILFMIIIKKYNI